MDEMWRVHDYNCHLMDLWGDWAEDPGAPAVQQARAAALTPQAFAQFAEGGGPEVWEGDEAEAED